MTTVEIIAEHLGTHWWEDKHDETAILVVLDRLMENGVRPEDLASTVGAATGQAITKEWERLSELSDVKLWLPTIPAPVLAKRMDKWQKRIESLLGQMFAGG